MVDLPPVPSGIYEQAAQQESSATSQADRLAREAARRAIEQGTIQSGQATHGGR